MPQDAGVYVPVLTAIQESDFGLKSLPICR